MHKLFKMVLLQFHWCGMLQSLPLKAYDPRPVAGNPEISKLFNMKNS